MVTLCQVQRKGLCGFKGPTAPCCGYSDSNVCYADEETEPYNHQKSNPESLRVSLTPRFDSEPGFFTVAI